jgi:arabinogalactan endo-1,4-beta-galactosidase
MKPTLLFILTFWAAALSAQTFYLGADLSYLNEMEDCNAIYYENQEARDPYQIFWDHNMKIVRYRLWHSPTWTGYSTREDVKKSLQRAKEKGFAILLDFHNSDTWADPANQLRPAAWAAITDLQVLGDSLYNYIYKTLDYFGNIGLLPDMVQIGNETNGNILLNAGEPLFPLTWSRNVQLFNRGIAAVADINLAYGTAIKTVIHIAQPENGLWWFEQAHNYGLTGFDIIGLSYYPGWSNLDIHWAANAIGELHETYNKDVLVVETGYPWTLQWADNYNNLLNSSNLFSCFGDAPTPELQRDYLTEFSWLVKEKGGMGVIYWEPCWVSTGCSTPWGTGSSWENATFFDFDYNLHAGIGFMDYDYSVKPPALDSMPVVFRVDMTGRDTTNGVFVTGDFTGIEWKFKRMQHTGQMIFQYNCRLPGRSEGAYIFQNKADWNTSSRETVPAACALYWDTHRKFVVKDEPVEFGFVWGSCEQLSGLPVGEMNETFLSIFPNPAQSALKIQSNKNISQIEISDTRGCRRLELSASEQQEVFADISGLPGGIYFVRVLYQNQTFSIHKIIKK